VLIGRNEDRLVDLAIQLQDPRPASRDDTESLD
jgi:hypothetical protein